MVRIANESGLAKSHKAICRFFRLKSCISFLDNMFEEGSWNDRRQFLDFLDADRAIRTRLNIARWDASNLTGQVSVESLEELVARAGGTPPKVFDGTSKRQEMMTRYWELYPEIAKQLHVTQSVRHDIVDKLVRRIGDVDHSDWSDDGWRSEWVQSQVDVHGDLYCLPTEVQNTAAWIVLRKHLPGYFPLLLEAARNSRDTEFISLATDLKILKAEATSVVDHMARRGPWKDDSNFNYAVAQKVYDRVGGLLPRYGMRNIKDLIVLVYDVGVGFGLSWQELARMSIGELVTRSPRTKPSAAKLSKLV